MTDTVKASLFDRQAIFELPWQSQRRTSLEHDQSAGDICQMQFGCFMAVKATFLRPNAKWNLCSTSAFS